MKSKIKQIISDSTNKSSLINLVLKPISMILSLIYVPLLLNYLGDVKYGLWSTILSIISWINYCDVGIGHGLRNILSKELSQGKTKDAKITISTAYIILTLISLLLMIICIIITFSVNWFSFFNTNIDMKIPILISFVFICVNFVLTLSNYIIYALQVSEKIPFRNCITQVMNIVGIFLLSKYTQGNLIYVAILFGITSTIIYVWTTIQIFSKNSELRPTYKCFNKSKIKEISNIGIKFFIIQIACIALYTVDNILITNLFGGAQVTPFNISYKVFNTIYAFLSALCIPYWSKTTSSIAEGNIDWVINARKKLNKIAVLFIGVFILLTFIFKPLTTLWLGRTLEYPTGLILVMCIYYCLYTIVTVNVQIINGTGFINFQLILMVFMGIANIPFSIFLAKNCGLGVVGIRLATTILMAIAAIAFPINLNKIIKKLKINEGEMIK